MMYSCNSYIVPIHLQCAWITAVQCSAFLCYKTVCFALFKGSTLEILSIFITHMSCFMGIVRS